jgi:parvulin-like peptidyl-prolyl isomerase
VPTRKRRVPRREIEARRQRMLRTGLAIAGVALLVILIGGALYENVIKPRQTLASVGGVAISREDYWKSRANDLYEQALQYQDFAQFMGPQQQNQYLAMAEQSLQQLPEVWGSTDVDPASLQKMIDDQVYLQGLEDLGLEVTPDEVRTFALNRFAPPGAPLIPAAVTPTLTAERAAMATSTAAAFAATPIASPAATPALATPVAASEMGTPPATPIASPATPVGTPNPVEARATAEAGFARLESVLFPVAHLSQADYDRLVAAPALARQKVREALTADVGQSAPQVRAAHLLVPTQEEAEAARARIVEGGESFATVAAEVSTDQASAANGGELGWFVREEMVAPFADAAFALEPGAVSEPVESEFGWHVIMVEETDPDRPLTDAQINRIEQAIADDWLQTERAALAISSSLPPTPTPFPAGFRAPAGAPPPPTPTTVPGTPVG